MKELTQELYEVIEVIWKGYFLDTGDFYADSTAADFKTRAALVTLGLEVCDAEDLVVQSQSWRAELTEELYKNLTEIWVKSYENSSKGNVFSKIKEADETTIKSLVTHGHSPEVAKKLFVAAQNWRRELT